MVPCVLSTSCVHGSGRWALGRGIIFKQQRMTYLNFAQVIKGACSRHDKLSSGKTLNPNLPPDGRAVSDALCINMWTFLSPLKRNLRLITADLA